MRFSPRRLLSRPVSIQAFTLIELLVVISIIAVLAGLLLPVGNRVIENSKRVSAKATMLQIVAAVKNYQSEYGVYPAPTNAAAAAGATPTDITFDEGGTAGSAGHNGILMDVLRARNNADAGAGAVNPDTKDLNPRRIVYFEYKDIKNKTNPIDGFIPTGADKVKDATGATLKPGDLVDNWGNLYCVRVDTGYSDKVVDPFGSNPSAADDAATTDKDDVHTGVIAWAIGASHVQYVPSGGTSGTTFENSGNVATWK